MTAIELLNNLRGLGVVLEAREHGLRVDAPKDALTDDLWTALGERKAEILTLLVCPMCGGLVEYTTDDRYVYLDCPHGHYASIQPKNWREPKDTKPM